MLRKNNKGFVLAESIIAAILVMTVFTTVIANVYPLMAKYKQIQRFNDVQGMHYANVLRDLFYDSIEMGKFNINICSENYCDKKSLQNMLSNIPTEATSKTKENFLDVTDAYYSKGNNITSDDISKRGFKAYLDYMKEQITDTDASKYYFFRIVDKDNYVYYSYIKVGD